MHLCSIQISYKCVKLFSLETTFQYLQIKKLQDKTESFATTQNHFQPNTEI